MPVNYGLVARISDSDINVSRTAMSALLPADAQEAGDSIAETGSQAPRCCYLVGAGADTRSMAANSSSLSSSVRAPEFSRTCSGLVAPGIGIT